MQIPRTRALEGAWEAAPATDHLQREHDPSNSALWEPTHVPGHWQSTETFAEHSGAVSYRHNIEGVSTDPNERCWLVLDGVFNQGDVWIDGEYVGDTEGYFFAHSFDVTDAIADGDDHQLIIDVISNKIGDPARKHALTGCYQYGDFFPPDANPGGIWRRPLLKFTGPVNILHSRVLCRRASRSRAEVDLRVVLESLHAHRVTITTKIAGESHERHQALAAGQNRIEWSVSVPEPDLWWPHRLGEQPLYNLTIEIADEHGVVSDGLERAIGLRSVRTDDGNLIINGERLYLKGSCLAPTSGRPAETTSEQVRADVDLARSAGLDAISVHAHVAAPELYEHADRTGMLVWQDLPMEGSYARAVKSQALRQAREAVDLLGHHASVIVWSPRSDPRRGANSTEGRLSGASLDRSLRRVLSSLDGTRPIATAKQVEANSPGAPRPYRLSDGGLVDQVTTRSPAMVTRFGAPGVSHMTDEQVGLWPRLRWQSAVEGLGLDIETQLAAVPIEPYDSLASWARATRQHQAQVMKGTVETARRNKYGSSAGYFQYYLRSPEPRWSYGLVDPDGSHGLSFDALSAASATTIVVAEQFPTGLIAGEVAELGVDVISDSRRRLQGCRVDATLTDPAGTQTWSWGGDIEPDTVTRIGTVRWSVPVGWGEVELDLVLITPEMEVHNQYQVRLPR